MAYTGDEGDGESRQTLCEAWGGGLRPEPPLKPHVTKVEGARGGEGFGPNPPFNWHVIEVEGARGGEGFGPNPPFNYHVTKVEGARGGGLRPEPPLTAVRARGGGLRPEPPLTCVWGTLTEA
jgi:hypothetical protein